MITFENTIAPSGEQWQSIILGARNAMNSWEKSDSGTCNYPEKCFADCNKHQCEYGDHFYIGPNDLNLMMKLRNAGTDHRKFMRMITVYVDITAPLYWFKEFDTYKVGTVANSCSTMHTIHKNKFDLNDFSCEHLLPNAEEALCYTITTLNFYREEYLETKDKQYWWQMIQLLPTSYNQKRTVMLNYEVLANIYTSRRDHKLDEWRKFCDWIRELPYSELIVGCKKPPSAEELDKLFDEVKKIDARVVSYEMHEIKHMQLLDFFDKNDTVTWAFDLNKFSLVEIPEVVKEGLDMTSNVAINAITNVSTNMLELGA